jgi:hypothetical protein
MSLTNAPAALVEGRLPYPLPRGDANRIIPRLKTAARPYGAIVLCTVRDRWTVATKWSKLRQQPQMTLGDDQQ